MRRSVLALLGLALLVPLLSACTKATQERDRVLAAIDQTERQAREFTYSDKSSGHTTVVKASVQDDLRYRADATRDGTAIASQVVYDDSRALQVLDPATLKAMQVQQQAVVINVVSGGASPSPSAGASPVPAASASPSPGASSVAPTDALLAGKWVVDARGASRLVSGALAADVGRDPIFDSLTTLEYVRQATANAASIQLFNPESENYRPKLDPFPRPQAGTKRYDFVAPVLSPHQGQGGALQRDVPNTAFFRAMSVYIRDGLVVDVRERISIAARLQDPQSNLEARLNDFVKGVSPSDPIAKQAAALLPSLNLKLRGAGQTPIRLRDMELSFTSLGHSGAVALPQGAVPGDLSSIGDHGQVLFEKN